MNFKLPSIIRVRDFVIRVRKFVIDVAVYVFIANIVYFGWQLLEMHTYGEIRPNTVDDTVGFILCLSLYLNYRLIKDIVRDNI